MGRSSKQKTNEEKKVLNDALHKMDLIGNFRIFHPNAEEYTFFSSAHGPFSRIGHILGQKLKLSKFKKTEIPRLTSTPVVAHPMYKRQYNPAAYRKEITNEMK